MQLLHVFPPWGVAAFLLLAFSSSQVAATGSAANVIVEWNFVTQKVVRTLGLPSQIASRTYAFVHLSQYKALQLAYKTGVSHPEATASYAAHYILSEIFPAQQSPIFDAAIAKQVTPLNLTEEEDDQIQEIGLTFAKQLLENRSHDGSQIWAKFHPSPPGSPAGQYQFTPNQTYSLYPQLAKTNPFVIKSADEFDTLGGPLKIPSAEYDSDYNVLATIGNANSTLQTKLQKDTAKFWEDGANTSTINGHFFNATLVIVRPNLSLKETAKLFAKISVAGYDSAIAGWYEKYKHLFWRPITALRQGDSIHKPILFTPFLKTPPHPEYPSTHSAAAGSWGAVLAKFLGISVSEKTPYGAYVVHTEAYFLAPRTYNTIADVTVEVSNSRVYGGIHFPKSVLDGLKLGYKVGDYVWDHFEEVFGGL